MRRLTRYLETLAETCSRLPDTRTGRNTQYTMKDIGLAAFSLFFMQCPSFLSFQRELLERQGRSNAHTLFGLHKIPSDNHIRKQLDGVPPNHFHDVFDALIEDLRSKDGLGDLRRLDDRLLIALDGTEYFTSYQIHCEHCSTRPRSDGRTQYYHSVLAATVVAPGQSRVLPLPPEFLRPQDGHHKQDCERQAAKRWLAHHAPRMAALKPVYLGDDLYACQSVCEAIRNAQGSFILTCKPNSHKTLYEFIHNPKTHQQTQGTGHRKRTFRYRWAHAVPLRDGPDAMTVNWFEIEIVNPKGRVTYRNAFITNLEINASQVAELAAAGRARWKIENETFNVLKHRGYHLEHNFGHGKDTLSSVLVTLNLLAFALHTACDLTETQWQAARARAGTRTALFQALRVLTIYHLFPSWNHLFTLLTTEYTAQPP